MINRKSQYTKPTMNYSNYIKLIGYLSANCTDKDYHKAMIKLDKFKIIVED
ncbi:hypothetical protein BNCALIDO_00171 [Aeromonas phage vB_AdhM_TS9]|nr:hypothetical protein BNCALIDO_00171 [Aeromonas phage vB_AdhM_TS9]